SATFVVRQPNSAHSERWALNQAVVNRRFPRVLIGATLALVLAGWLAIVRSDEIDGAANHLVRQQIVWTVIGLSATAAVAMADYRRSGQHAALAYGGITIALLAAYAFPAVNGAHRWVRLGGIGIQPSEFAKLVFIVALARYLMHRDVAAG